MQGCPTLIKENVLILGAYDSNGTIIDGNEEGATVVFNLLLENEDISVVINELHKCTNIVFVKAEDID